MFAGAPYEFISTHFLANNDENLIFNVKTSNQAEATNSGCPEAIEGKCHIKYSLRYTPLLHDISPN